MKFPSCIFLAWLLVAAPLVLPLGCSTTQEVKAAQTILAVQTSVDNAMNGFATQIGFGNVSIEDRIKVRRAYQGYKALEATAITALELGTTLDEAVAPEELADAAFELIILLSQF